MVRGSKGVTKSIYEKPFLHSVTKAMYENPIRHCDGKKQKIDNSAKKTSKASDQMTNEKVHFSQK